jgi:hypothetical protein
MRTTLDIDDDVLAAAKERAAEEKSTAGKVISDLARQALTRPAPGPLIEQNGFLVLPSRGGVVTSALVRRLEHEADLQEAGLRPKDE